MILTNSYLDLGEEFFQRIPPTPVSKPELLLWNSELATELELPETLINDRSALSQYFSGNKLFPDSTPIALAYAGHQFGQFNPRLGDGRAHLLGELNPNDHRLDIQLKGSGPTRFSRRGDGRCALGPAVREFIMSEAMYALGVPTSRTLAVVTSGEHVVRDGARPGAIVTRVAESHLRVGTFELFASQGKLDSVEKLCLYAIDRHYPELNQLSGPERIAAFFRAVMTKQIELIIQWMRVGFIHGVMNTDNTAISGETIDYGPCAMMNAYDPKTVFSSIDVNGRYMFGNQPQIGLWNMTRFVECLLPLLHEDSSVAKSTAEEMLAEYSEIFRQKYFAIFGKKIGFNNVEAEDETLIDDLLATLISQGLDYTRSFNHLTNSLLEDSVPDSAPGELNSWIARWKGKLQEKGLSDNDAYKVMRGQNPAIIPRNHHMEAAIDSCVWEGSTTKAAAFLLALKSPYEETDLTTQYQDTPADGDRHYQTFCGT